MRDKGEGYDIGQIDQAMKKKTADSSNLRWYSPLEPPFRLAGFPWISEYGMYRRLPPGEARKLPVYVDILADCTAGGQISFRTNSAKLIVKVELTGHGDMDHMPATGQCGFDCYLGGPLNAEFCNTVRHDPAKSSYESILFDIKEIEMKAVLLNFPLYRGVRNVFIGLDAEADVDAPAPYLTDKAIIAYGTSITQGGCASRPGMAYTNILSRKLNIQVINMGFSGNGKGEPEMARLISEIPDPACFILDYEGNANDGGILENTLPDFIDILRSKHKDIPVLVVSKVRYARENFLRKEYEKLLYFRDFQMELVNEKRRNGDKNIHFFNGMDLLGTDFSECTVDGVHPTDLGFWRMADKLEPILRTLITK